ncbi:hypothetical protein D3C73_185950 [compost metagenome]
MKYISQLPNEEQKAIISKVIAKLITEGYSPEEITDAVFDAMDSKLCDLEDILN